MTILSDVWRRLAAWFAQAAPAVAEASDDTLRKSIHDVTLEQLGIAHWSCHTHF